ncbi:MAG: hypothetical protein ACFFCW_10465 [Candidatus Hodarchaeota archaeon]
MKKIACITLMSLVLVILAGCVAGWRSATAPPPPTSIIGDEEIVDNSYIHEEKGYKIVIPPQEWSATSMEPLDIAFKNERGGGWIGTAALAMPKSFMFENVNRWWVSIISKKWGLTDIKIVDERELTIDGHNAKVVVFEFTRRNIRQVDMTYHIWKPTGKYKLYRIRMTCFKDKFEEFLDVYKAFVNSFSFL